MRTMKEGEEGINATARPVVYLRLRSCICVLFSLPDSTRVNEGREGEGGGEGGEGGSTE